MAEIEADRFAMSVDVARSAVTLHPRCPAAVDRQTATDLDTARAVEPPLLSPVREAIAARRAVEGKGASRGNQR